MITVAEYNHADQLKPFQPLWTRLLDRTPESCISHTWDWINSQTHSQDLKPRILVAFLGGRPFGVLPLKVESRSTPWGSLRCLTSIGEPWFPFAGPLGPNTTAMLAAALRHIHRTRRDWDMVEFRLSDISEMLRRRLENAFRLVGWSCDLDPTDNWLEIDPELVITAAVPGRLNLPLIPKDRMTFERHRSDKSSRNSVSVVASCLSLINEIRGPSAANDLKMLSEAGSRAGVVDWCLLHEEGIPLAAAMNLITPHGIRTMALVGRNELVRSELIQRMLENAVLRGDGAYLLPVADVPFSERWTNATRRGFRYTHLSPWAIRARWQRFRERLQPVRRISGPTEPAPTPRMLKLYSP